jgi:D-alanyl-lipoteichoic acid acyltransferase DltB (MBOAT superfamily)
MMVNSLSFLGFALAFAAAYNLISAQWWRQTILLIANLGFLASFVGNWQALLPFAAFLVLGYAAVRVTLRGISALAHAAIILAVIVLFCWLKRYAFMPASTFLDFSYTTIGLSYILFRLLHLIIDAASDDLASPLGPVGYLNYLLNFTSLVSGPIQRWPDFAAQQQAAGRPPLDMAIAGAALERIILGMFKTIVIGGYVSGLQGDAALLLGQPMGVLAKVGVAVAATALYTIYLYADFSGYCDIVIGLARFFRLKLPENFNRPFLSENFLDFWGRWHITLSEWFKTYLYNTASKAVMARNPTIGSSPLLAVGMFFFTFFLIGLWHGQSSAFVAYGLLLGLGAASNRLWQVTAQKRLGKKGYKALAANAAYREIARGLTFTWLSVSLICFWTDGARLAETPAWLGAAGVALFVPVSIAVWILAITVAHALHDRLAPAPLGEPAALTPTMRIYKGAACATMLYVVVLFAKSGLKPFIYAQF